MGKIVIAGQEVTEFDELRVASDRSIIKARQEKLDRDHQAHLRQEKLSKYKLWKPFPDNIRIDKSHIHGWGIFCNDENGIKKDTRLGITHIFTKLEEFQENDHGLIRTAIGAFINHSKTPNCEKQKHKTVNQQFIHGADTTNWRIRSKDKYYTLVALKDIPYNHELTVCYTLYEIPDEEDL